MPRTLPAQLEAAMNGGTFQSYFLITVREVGFAVIETATPLRFKLKGIRLEAAWARPQGSIYNGFTNLHDLEFKITRGVTIAGVNYTIDSSYYYGTSQIWDGYFQSITACMLPDQKYSAAGDGTYKTVIEALCTNFNKTAVFDTPTANWLNYQFLGDGKILTLNRSNSITNMLKQKYIIHACDNGNNEILFKAIGTDPDGSTDHTLSIGLINEIGIDVSERRRFLYRDEAGTVHYSGNASDPLWNLGYLESTASPPTTTNSFAFSLKPIAPHLKYLSFDKFAFTFENYPESGIISHARVLEVIEEFNYQFNEIPWRITLEGYHWAKGTEGGALPGTIEQAAPYTPLNTSAFDGVLTSEDNNIQAAMDTLDDHDHGNKAKAIQAPAATNDFLVGEQVASVWTWVRKTLAQTITILRTSLDAVYAAASHSHSGLVTNGDSHDHNGGDGAQIPADGISAKSIEILGGHGNGGTVPASSTNYICPFVPGIDTVGRSFPISKAGTLKNLFLRLASAQPASGSLVAEIFAGASGTTATGIKITIAAGSASGTYSNTTNSYAFSAGDLVKVNLTNNATAPSGVIGGVSFQLDFALVN